MVVLIVYSRCGASFAARDAMDPQIDTSSGEPTRAAIDALAGPTLLEFGSPWCGHCRAAQPLIANALKRTSRRSPRQGRGRQRPAARPLVRRQALADAGLPRRRPRSRSPRPAARSGGDRQGARAHRTGGVTGACRPPRARLRLRPVRGGVFRARGIGRFAVRILLAPPVRTWPRCGPSSRAPGRRPCGRGGALRWRSCGRRRGSLRRPCGRRDAPTGRLRGLPARAVVLPAR